MGIEDESKKSETPIVNEVKEDEKGTVKKKIDILGVGEIEYTEKTVMFPEKIVQKTGGVKGYIRKMISWEELIRFWDLDESEWEKIKEGQVYDSREDLEEENKQKLARGRMDLLWDDNTLDKHPRKKSLENFLMTDGFNKIISELTNEEFINQTFNHVVLGRREGQRELTKERMLEMLNTKELNLPFDYYGLFYDLEDDRLLSSYELFGKANLSDDLLKKYILCYESDRLIDHYYSKGDKILVYLKSDVSENDYILFEKEIKYDEKEGPLLSIKTERNKHDDIIFPDFALSEEEKKLIIGKLEKCKNVYYYSSYGLNLTNQQEFWRGYHFHGKYNANGISPNNIVLGFKFDTRNSVLRDYCTKILNLVKEQKARKSEKDSYYYRKNSRDKDARSLAINTVKSLVEPMREWKGQKVSATGRIGNSLERGEHPYLPIVVNHPNLPELRWCHADYAAIPTKNGYNIIEMIT